MNSKNRQFFEGLVHSHAGDLYRFAFRMCGKRQMADDLVQETFCEAWRSIDRLRDPVAARAWLMQILRHCYAHAMRDRGRRISASGDSDQLNDIAAPGPDVLQRLSDEDLLQRALERLNERFREPFLLVFLEGLTCQEAAVQLDLPLGTILSRIHRARQQLRRTVRQLDPGATESPRRPSENGRPSGASEPISARAKSDD